MMSNKIILLLFLVFLNKGNCLKCYHCTTETGQNSPCEDLSIDKSKVTTKDCADGEICAVYVSRAPGSAHDSITRTCAPKNICEPKNHEDEVLYIKKCRSCNKDLCDSGNGIYLSWFAIFSALIAIFIHL